MDLLPYPRDRWHALRLYPKALAVGVGVGTGVVLLFAAADAALPPRPPTLAGIVARAGLIYLPAGLAAGLWLLRVEPRRRSRLAPAGLHGLLVGLLLAVVHALLLLALNRGEFANVRFSAAEALVVALLAAVAGGLAGDVAAGTQRGRTALAARNAQRRARRAARRDAPGGPEPGGPA